MPHPWKASPVIVVTQKLQPPKGSPYYTRASAGTQDAKAARAAPHQGSTARSKLVILYSFEGIDGSGKSTQIEQLQRRLEEAGHRVLRVREPGGTHLSERIREVLLDDRHAVDPFAELLLFSAARRQLVTEVIGPALQAGTVVLCDRFFDSTTAYQGGGRMVEEVGWIDEFQRRVTGGIVPDRTYYLRVSPDVAALRRGRRTGTSEPADRMEAAGSAFFQRVIAAYDALAEREAGRIHIVDATRGVDDIAAEIWADASRLLHPPQGTAERGRR